MGLPFLDTSSTSTSNVFAPTVGGQSETAPVAPVVIDGNRSNQSVTINQTQTFTDLGAIEAASNFAIDAGMIAENMAQNAFDTTNNITGRGLDVVERGVETVVRTSGDNLRDLIGFGQGLLDGAAGLVRDALKETTYQQQQAQAAASAAIADAARQTGIAIDSNTMISRDSIDLSRSVVDLTGELNEQNIMFLTDANKLQSETLGGAVSEVTESLEFMEAARGQESQRNLAAIQELATTVSTGGENLQANMNKLIAGLAIVTVGFVAWQAVRS